MISHNNKKYKQVNKLYTGYVYNYNISLMLIYYVYVKYFHIYPNAPYLCTLPDWNGRKNGDIIRLNMMIFVNKTLFLVDN